MMSTIEPQYLNFYPFAASDLKAGHFLNAKEAFLPLNDQDWHCGKEVMALFLLV